MKISIKNKTIKQDLILFIGIWVFSMIVNNAFLQRHYSSDTMCLIDVGYFEYPLKFFLLDGRIISTLWCYLGGILKIPLDTYLFISNFAGIMLLALSVIILFKFTIKYLNIENKWIKFMVLLSVYTIIFNHMDIEYFIFQECCVMCAGILFSIIAAIKYLEDKKGKIYKSFIFLLISTLCYQGVLSIFPTIVIILNLLKKKDINKLEISKFYMKDIFKLSVMYILVMLISAGIIIIFNNLLDASSNRLERISKVIDNLILIPNTTLKILLYQINRVPAFFSLIVLFITIIITNNNNNLSYKYILVVFTAYMFCIIPLLIFGYARGRLLMAIGSITGISLLFITKALEDDEDSISIKSIKTIIISICVISYFIFNIINNSINGYEHLKSFKIDEEIGKRINKIVTNYEKSSGKEISRLAYCVDKEPQIVNKEIKDLGPLTERKFAIPVKESLNYYCNKKLEEVKFSLKVYYDNFYNKNYTEFSEEQFVFVNDIMYMCIY